MSGLTWYSPDNFPIDYEGIVIVKYENNNENCYGTYKFWPTKGIWTLGGIPITHMAAVNEPSDESRS